MKTSARFLLSAVTGFGLAAFILFSAFTAGANAPATVIAFSLLVMYGVLEIAILSYASPRFEVRPPSARPAPRLVAEPTLPRARTHARVSALVELPSCGSDRRAA